MQFQAHVLRQTQNQTLRILPQQIQFLNLLHLNLQELERFLQKELEENPFLEENTEASSPAEIAQNENDDDETTPISEGDFEDPMNWGSLDDETPDYKYTIEQGFSDEEIYQAPAVQMTTIREDLKSQCAFLAVSEEERLICEYLIDSLDDSGYLTTPLDTVVDYLSFSQNIFITEAAAEQALRVLQSLDPPGIGARNLSECLLLQIDRLEKMGEELVLPRILIRNYMDALAAHNYEFVKNALRLEAEELKAALDFILTLNPKPLRGFSDGASFQPDTITPEYIIEMDGDDFIISLSNTRAGIFRLSPDAVLQAQNTRDKSAKSFVQKKIEDANWLIAALQQRDDTMLNTIRTIVMLQRDFFKTGDFKKLKPMILRDVAAYVNLDISTISRVTSHKYVQTPFGILSVKDFFTQTFTSQDGVEISNQDVMDALRELVETENKTAPLNDAQLTEMLAEKGFKVARRTVAKYRDLLQIPVADLRREV